MSGLLHCQAGEEAQLDDACLLGIERRQPLKRTIDRKHVLGPRRIVSLFQCHVDRDPRRGVAALGRVACTGVIHQDAAHELRGESEEVRAILPGRPPLIHKAEVELVNESGRNERVIDTFASQLAGRNPPQFTVNHGQQLLERGGVPFRPPDQQLCQIR